MYPLTPKAQALFGQQGTGLPTDPNNAIMNVIAESQSSPAPTQQAPAPAESGPANVSSAPVYDAAAAQRAAELAQARANLDREEGRIDPQYNIARSNLLDQFNAARNALLGGKERATRDYDTTVTRTKQNKQDTNAKIDQGVSQQFTGIKRLLGARGAGNSSAAQILAPYAVGQVGNAQRGDIQRAYGLNMQDIETKRGDYMQDWQNKFNQTNTDQENQIRGLDQKRAEARLRIQQERQSLDPYNAASYNGRINDLIGQIDNLARVSTYQAPTAAYVAPQLQPYSFKQAAAPSYGQSAASQEAVGPYYTLLGGEEQKKDQVIA